jgi:hypothetical protein
LLKRLGLPRFFLVMRKMLLIGLVGFGLLCVRKVHASSDSDNLRPDVLACEEAVKHLVDCCEGFNPKAVTCTYYKDENVDCDYTETTVTTPTYGEDVSACIVALDCNSLRTTGVCQRAQGAVAPSSTECDGAEDFCGAPDYSSYSSSSSSSGSTAPQQVCP